METDNTLLEMQRQMQQLREKLESQKIVNDRILRKSCSQTLNRLKLKSNVPIIAGAAAILGLPSFHYWGFSDFFIIFTVVMMLVCIAVTVWTNRYLPRMDRDLVTAAEEIGKFKKINAEWIKIGIPMLLVWLGILVWDVFRNVDVDQMEKILFLCGVGVGIMLGVILGLKLRRDLLDASDDLLSQIEELKG